MITACCRFAHSFKIMRIPPPVYSEDFPPRTIQRFISGRGGEVDVLFNRCIKGQEPEVFELRAFAEDGIREVHPYARFQISNDFIRETFHTHFFNALEVRIPFLGPRSVNGSVQWLDVPCPFGETGISAAAWTENTFVNSWGTNPTRIPNRPIRWRTTFPDVPINLHTAARCANHDLLWANRVDRRQTLQRELHARILLDICDKVLSDDSNDGWLEEFSDW